MIYCEGCRKENQWPESVMTAFATCELCQSTELCYLLPSEQLPKINFAPMPEGLWSEGEEEP